MAGTDDPSRAEGIGPIDQVYIALRGAALLAAAAFGFMRLDQPEMGDAVLRALGVFALYGALAYTVGLPWLRGRHKRRFYALLGGADLLFVIALMHLTGGVNSPFYRALYLWVAMPAFYFGFRAGSLASAVALGVFGWFFAGDSDDLWELGVRCGALALHGPLIGYLVERDRAHREALRRAQAALEATTEKLRSS